MNDSFLMMFDMISLACGVFCIYTCIKLRQRGGKLFNNSLLIPKGKTEKDCLDEEAYSAYIAPKLMVLGILITLFGAVNLLNEYLNLYGLLVSEILTGCAFVSVVWYAVCNSKANKRYW